MAALIQFVDSISDDPVVRLDLNDGVSWFCQLFKAPPPRLRRSESDNSMRDGGVVGSSSYGNRTLELDLTLIEEGDEEWAAQEMQKLWRELDRPQNFIRYWPEGLDKPVFFRTFRSDVSELEELWTTPIARNISLEILAEPHALGLPETLGPYTINGNPAAVSNPCYVDLPTILGDVPAPLVYWDTSGIYTGRTIAAWATTGTLQHIFKQAEDMILGTGTTNPGGAASGNFSGAGSTNYVQTTFTSSSMSGRLSWTPSGVDGVCAGQWRVLAFVALNSAASGYSVRAQVGSAVGRTVALGSTNNRVQVDLGVFDFGDPSYVTAGYGGTVGDLEPPLVTLQAAGPTTTTLRWDCVVLVPAGGQRDSIVSNAVTSAAGSNASLVLDGVREAVGYDSISSNPLTGSTGRGTNGALSGAFPSVSPGASNRLYVFTHGALGSAVVGSSVTTSAAYWPRYLFVRPVSS